MNHSPDHKQNEKAVRLIEYLLRLASLRTKLVRGVADYEKVLWLKDIPKQKRCFTQAWGRDEDYDSDIWVEVQNRREPQLPSVPGECQSWANRDVLRNKNDIPELLREITRSVRNPTWEEGSDQPEFIHRTERLDEHPEIQKAWERYVEEHWLPWVEEHNIWESVHGVYSSLFAIHQEQLRLGEEYELVLGLGLLTWRTPKGQTVRRHLLVANTLLQFEARLEKFTVQPNPDGASVRCELDMLDIEEQPPRAEESAKNALTNAGDDPWAKDCINGVLETIVHSINPQSEYDCSLETKSVRATDKPVVEYAPAVILRKRSGKGLTDTLRKIKEKIETGKDIPTEFMDLAEVQQRNHTDSVHDIGETSSSFDGEIFFPKPSNEEQRRIVDKIRAASGVLVQGPPGTGKSHTIANLICHMLATGQRTLITAKTPRALQVLKGLVPSELRPLCINLLGSGLEEKRSLESSIAGILRKNEEWNEERAVVELKALEQKLRRLREEKAQIERRLRAIRESETRSQTIAEGAYRGTAAQIAKNVKTQKTEFGWFMDKVPLNEPCPISETDLQSILVGLRRLTPDERKQLALKSPNALPSIEQFDKLVRDEKQAIENEQIAAHEADSFAADALAKSNERSIRTLEDALVAFINERHRLSVTPFLFRILKKTVNVARKSWSREDSLSKCRSALQQCGGLVAEPIWSKDAEVRCMLASCRLALARISKRCAEEEIRKIEIPVATVAADDNAHPITLELLEAIRKREIDVFARSYVKNQDLNKKRQSAQKVAEGLKRLRQIAPKLTEDLMKTFRNPYWESRGQQIRNAWHWAQAKKWIGEYIRKEDVPGLNKRMKQIEDDIGNNIAKAASLRAWSFCFSRLNEDHRQHMESWQQSMRRLGKGTGKHAPRHRREAQQHLNKCREAVPAWVMPLHRVWDTVDPAPRIFDLIVVDEASQCGFEALPLFYLGKKILIVGDDKQISPEEGFIDKNIVFQLMEQFLDDFDFKDSFHRDASLFDHAKRLYGTSRITLREHFRCMPEIIRFSNDLCYADTPLIPLRQYGPNRLIPIERIFVEHGYREGSVNRVVNRPEADEIVAKINELCIDPKYTQKTMGVVVLQGNEQARLIDGMLLDRLGAAEMERRRLVCGNSYSFQGDERDIMFLSMVAARNENIHPFTKASDERRFNVAASRARDQVWLFHSVTRDDLSTVDLRRKLLEFFEETQPRQIAGIEKEELERRAAQDNRAVVKPPQPFESWFEVDVALELLRKGFDVKPQFEVASKRIDLVAEGGHARLAVECDGDEWHGVEQYEADMQRQRQLERCGWEFFRVRESAFHLDREDALRGLWYMLEERGIMPMGSASPAISDDEENKPASDYLYIEEVKEEISNNSFSKETGVIDERVGRRPQDIAESSILDAILHALKKCPNYSCTLQSLTKRVLKEVDVITRGKPRLKFEKRVMRMLDILEEREQIEKYKAKNKRVRLLKSPMR